MTAKKKSGLGNNPLVIAPLNQSIFQKTDLETKFQKTEDEIQQLSELEKNQECFSSSTQKPDSRNQIPENGFLQPERELDKVTLRIPIELNDWLDSLLKQGKRKYGQKIPKEIWIQAALELFKAMPIDWTKVESIEQMREILQNLENGIQKMES